MICHLHSCTLIHYPKTTECCTANVIEKEDNEGSENPLLINWHEAQQEGWYLINFYTLDDMAVICCHECKIQLPTSLAPMYVC